MNDNNLLLSPYALTKQLTLKNRIIMAPMTRAFATDASIPTEQMAAYYARRAAAGLIITEGTVISKDGHGYPNIPGLYNQAQTRAWQGVTDAVHQQQGLIFSQLWHVGRVSHPSFLEGQLPISASATTMKERIPRSEGLFYGTSRAATLDEIKQLIEAYAIAAEHAMQAGFDGVELHGANGYLIDQFLHHDTNHREDEYGMTPDNMSRFPLEVIHAIGERIGFEKLGLRLTPGTYMNEINMDARDKAVFEYLLQQCNQLSLAYVHTGNFDDSVTFAELDGLNMTTFLRKHYQGNLIACGGYGYQQSLAGLANGAFDLVAIGRSFIANPDLIEKFKQDVALTPYHADMLKTLY